MNFIINWFGFIVDKHASIGLCVLAVMLGVPTNSWALRLTYEAELELNFGTDPAGLAGSQVAIEMFFAEDQEHLAIEESAVEADAASVLLPSAEHRSRRRTARSQLLWTGGLGSVPMSSTVALIYL